MKTSKRLLSILLMLTMLLSMFTVMASADGCTHPGNKHFEKHSADCTNDGNWEYWYCPDCGDYWIVGANGTGFTSKKEQDTVISATGHRMIKHDRVEATTENAGNILYYTCENCHKFFTDEAGQNEITEAETIIPKISTYKVTIVAKNVENAQEGKIWYLAGNSSMQSITQNGQVTLEGLKTGEKVMLQAIPKSDQFKTVWTIDGIVQNDNDFSRDIMVGDKDVTVEVDIQPAGHKLTINVDPEGAGTVKANLQNLEALPEGTEIELTATPKEGYTFKEWRVTGDAIVKGNEKATVTMGKKDATVTAVFAKTAFTLTVKADGKGTVEYKNEKGKWVDATTTPITGLKAGAKVELRAKPNSNYMFESWKTTNGATVNKLTAKTVTLTMGDKDATATAVFTKKTSMALDLTIKVSGFDKGNIEYKYNGGKVTDLEKREKTWSLDDKDEYVKFWLYPKTGYKAVVQLNDGKKYTYSYNESLTIDYDDLDGEDGTLYVSFVKKSSSDVDDYPTLTFDITGGKHGTVYRGTREYEHGDVISIKKNDKMTFKAKADKGYVTVWTYKGDTYVGDEYTVKMGATDAKLYVEFMDKDDIRLTELPFRDVSKRDWYYDDVVYVYRKGYMDGMSSTRFGGELNTTRGQIVTILWRLTGEPRATKRNPFTDVSSKQYYYDAISWAYDAGVVDGFDARTFKPDQNVTREQLAAILYRYAKYMNLSTSGSAYLAKYRDADKIANWAYDAMAWANYRGLINGTSATRIDPKGYATRAQIAAILHRFAVEYGA